MESPSSSLPHIPAMQVSSWSEVKESKLLRVQAPNLTTLPSAPFVYASDEPEDIEEATPSLSASDSEEPAPDSPVPKPKGFRNGRDARESDVFIAVMGVTGSGKSSFISACSDRPAKVGHSLEACTSTVDVYPCNFLPNRTVYLIDTPGFDDTDKSDTEVLREIAAWLADSYKNEILLHGIIYLHRITDVRMQGSAKRNLTLFKKLCGVDALKRVILAATMWDKIEREVAERREAELMDTPEFWGWMVGQGSRVHRHRGGKGHEAAESAKKIVHQLVEHTKPVAVSLQKQLVDDGLTLDRTSAGEELQSELLKERVRWAKELQQVEENMRIAMEQRDLETEQIMREERDRYTGMIKKAQEKTDALSLTVENLITQRDERVAQMAKELRKERNTKEQLKREKIQLQKREKELESYARHESLSKRAAGGQTPSARSRHSETFPSFSVSIFDANFSLKSRKCSRTNMLAPTQRASLGVKMSATIAGEQGSWVARYSDGTWRRSKFFERYYPHLDGKLQQDGANRLAICSLGSDQQYYARWTDNTWSCYAHNDTTMVIKDVTKTCRKHSGYKVQSVALGFGNTYIISYGQSGRSKYKCDLKAYYPQLRQVLDENKPVSILAVSLSPRNIYDYVLVFSDRDVGSRISWFSSHPDVDKEIRAWCEKTRDREA